MRRRDVRSLLDEARRLRVRAEVARGREAEELLRRARLALLEARVAHENEATFAEFLRDTRAAYGGVLPPNVQAIVNGRRGLDTEVF
jgi:Xaa-Pro aminopeptidase